MTVYLVGAGPGDPGLITVRGAALLSRAEVVIHDRLTAAELLELAPPGAERIDVGKRPRGRSVPQEEINELLIHHGRAGRRVVRLKGGDPTVFARGGEEAEALMAAGVPVEIVPGITSAIAVPAYAGIPVTFRYSSTSVTIVTGHEDPTKTSTTPGASVDWDAVARVGGTVVILMGVANWPSISRRLLDAGMSPDTPAAAIRWGTRPTQHTVRATLATLGDHELAAPSTIVIGEVAGRAVPWFERRPLAGRTVVVTRTRAQAGRLSAALREAGAEVLEVPVIAIADPSDGGAALDAALARVRQNDWLVVTSPNGADRVCARLRDGRDLAGVRIAAIGPGTAAALAKWRLEADLVPEQFIAESLLDALGDPPEDRVGRILIARAEVARDVLPEGLAGRGWEVEVVPAYRTVPAEVSQELVERVAAADLVTFTSSSTVTHAVAAFGPDRLPPAVVCIGPITAATAHEAGVDVTSVAERYSIDGLVDAVLDWAAGNREQSPSDGGS